MDNQLAEEEFTEEELRMGVKIFTALYWFMTFLLLSAIVVAVYLGFKAVLWYVVIPSWAACNFGLRVIKRYFRNIIQSFEKDLDELAPAATAEVMNEPVETKEISKPKGGVHSTFLVMMVMLTVSAMWYCTGLLLRLVV
ncbi:MAG: hypothetical protein AAGJ68_05425 [Pseudomonadota bacterium]